MARIPKIICVLTRMPARIDGHARGISILASIRSRFNPTPFAASVTAGSTDANPMIVFLMIGSNAYSTSAVTVGATPKPRMGINRPNRANEGIVRIVLASAVAIDEPAGDR